MILFRLRLWTGSDSGCTVAPFLVVVFLLIGSGVTVSNGAAYLEFADGVIVGTSVKRDGKVSNPVDSNRVAALRKAIQ